MLGLRTRTSYLFQLRDLHPKVLISDERCVLDSKLHLIPSRILISVLLSVLILQPLWVGLPKASATNSCEPPIADAAEWARCLLEEICRNDPEYCKGEDQPPLPEDLNDVPPQPPANPSPDNPEERLLRVSLDWNPDNPMVLTIDVEEKVENSPEWAPPGFFGEPIYVLVRIYPSTTGENLLRAYKQEVITERCLQRCFRTARGAITIVSPSTSLEPYEAGFSPLVIDLRSGTRVDRLESDPIQKRDLIELDTRILAELLLATSQTNYANFAARLGNVGARVEVVAYQVKSEGQVVVLDDVRYLYDGAIVEIARAEIPISVTYWARVLRSGNTIEEFDSILVRDGRTTEPMNQLLSGSGGERLLPGDIIELGAGDFVTMIFPIAGELWKAEGNAEELDRGAEDPDKATFASFVITPVIEEMGQISRGNVITNGISALISTIASLENPLIDVGISLGVEKGYSSINPEKIKWMQIRPKGTVIAIEVGPDQASIFQLEGDASFTDLGGNVLDLSEGQMTTIGELSSFSPVEITGDVLPDSIISLLSSANPQVAPDDPLGRNGFTFSDIPPYAIIPVAAAVILIGWAVYRKR